MDQLSRFCIELVAVLELAAILLEKRHIGHLATSNANCIAYQRNRNITFVGKWIRYECV